MTAEEKRLEESRTHRVNWKRWGPYLSNRQWGTVREDYSPDGTPWEYFPFEHAGFRAYRWGEDGIGGISDKHQIICFSPSFWNGRDPILKERLFGLTGHQGNHGEDVKEYYFHLDSTPTHSYMKFLYKYPQMEFPYKDLLDENRRRDRTAFEYELLDTGIFNQDRYFDIFIEYAKFDYEDILIKFTIHNCGPEAAELHLLPTIWFRNTWSWSQGAEKPRLHQANNLQSANIIALKEAYYGDRWLICGGNPELLFTENETNYEKLNWGPNNSQYVKDAFDDYIIHSKNNVVNPSFEGTKGTALYHLNIDSGSDTVIKLRFTNKNPNADMLGDEFESTFAKRRSEADEFYKLRIPENLTEDGANIQRQAFAGMLWNKQHYHYDIRTWLSGDPNFSPPPPQRLEGRNHKWTHLYNADVISMPDKWEYPWYGAWDLAFHCITLALIDPDFAKEQLLLFLREWYMHPSGQLPAYEWDFGNVNPPVHAWAAWRVYKIEKRIRGHADRSFLEKIFHKLLINFTWWVNREDAEGNNVFEGGFLGMDNIGVFDRSAPLPSGEFIEQSDGTSWMGMYCLNMLVIALELAREDSTYGDVASKFFEHFVYIADAMNNIGPDKIELWDEGDGFYYDVLHLPDGRHRRLKIRSMVGLIPLFAVDTLEPEMIENLPGFQRRMRWFIENRPEFHRNITTMPTGDGKERRLLSIVGEDRLPRILKYLLDENEFLAPNGIRALSRFHLEHPFEFDMFGQSKIIKYEPAESSSPMFGGNSNWRGPIWFPLNFLLIESLQKFHHFYGDDLKFECPTGSGMNVHLWDIAREISLRLNHIFLRNENGVRPVHRGRKKFQEGPRWKDLILFHEYFNGDNGAGIGANHQTGWTGLVAKLLEQSGS